MRLFLNNIFKGLLVSLLVITLGGFLYINISEPKEIDTKLKLISSSVINQIVTESVNQEDTENNESKVLVENKEEEKIKEEKEEVNDKIEESKVLEVETEKKEEETNQQEDTTTKETEKTTTDSNQNTTPKENSEPDAKPQAPAKPSNPYAPNLEVASTMTVLDTYYGNITAYGPDCYGCGGMVAHGENVTNGNIYYNDKTFGNIRIVAGDKSLKFGTIVRISGLKNTTEPILAIVLDTGGDIGFNKPKQIYFDLLYESESKASSFGLQKATFEILRYGGI